MKVLSTFIALILMQVVGEAKELLHTNFSLDSIAKVYKSPYLITHCERFNLDKKYLLNKITLGLISNRKNIPYKLKVYKYEGQQSVPRTEVGYIYEGKFTKDSIGFEEVEIKLENEILVEYEQIFVCFEPQAEGLFLYSDDTHEEPYCQNGIDVFTYQMQKDKNDKWFFGNYNYYVVLHGEELKDEREKKVFNENTPSYFEKGIVDSINNIKIKNLCVFDIEKDGRNEFIVNNRYFSYDDKTKTYKYGDLDKVLDRNAFSNVIFDYNGDGKLDLASMSYESKTVTVSGKDTVIRLGSLRIIEDIAKKKNFRILNHKSQLIQKVSSIVSEDLDLDGKDELVITQSDTLRPLDNFYISFINNEFVFNDLKTSDYNSVNGSYSFCLNSYDKKTLVIFNESGELEKWEFNFAERKKNIKKREVISKLSIDSSNKSVTYDLGSLNNSSNKKEKVYINNSFYKRLNKVQKPGTIKFDYKQDEDSLSDKVIEDNSWIIASSGLVNGDLDNDAKDDVIIFSADKCYSANLLLNKEDVLIKDNNISGFKNFTLGNDGILTDINIDGKLDLMTFSNGSFVILTNQLETKNNYVKLIDKKSEDIKEGTKLVLFLKDEKIELEYRTNFAWNIQSPKEIHFGIAENREVDSAYVLNQNQSKVIYDIKPNQTLDISKLKSKEYLPEVTFASYPNPFTDEVNFNLTTNIVEDVDIHILDINGNEIKSIYNGRLKRNNNKLSWDGTNHNGDRMRSGTYFLDVNYKNKTFTEKIVKVN